MGIWSIVKRAGVSQCVCIVSRSLENCVRMPMGLSGALER